MVSVFVCVCVGGGELQSLFIWGRLYFDYGGLCHIYHNLAEFRFVATRHCKVCTQNILVEFWYINLPRILSEAIKDVVFGARVSLHA